MTNVIEIDGLHKSYRRLKGTAVALGGLGLAVPEGGVYGFLGPNGSGETTVRRDSIAEARTSPSLVFPVVALIPNSTRVGRSLPRWLVVLLALVGVPIALQALMALFGLLAGAS